MTKWEKHENNLQTDFSLWVTESKTPGGATGELTGMASSQGENHLNTTKAPQNKRPPFSSANSYPDSSHHPPALCSKNLICCDLCNVSFPVLKEDKQVVTNLFTQKSQEQCSSKTRTSNATSKTSCVRVGEVQDKGLK